MRLADDPRFAPIATAPRDGTPILVAHEDSGCFLVRWNPSGNNAVFAPDDVSIWEAPDGSFTWKDSDGHGPSHWSPYEPRSLN